MRSTGTYAISTTLGEAVQAFVPHPLPPSAPPLSPDAFASLNHAAELALARLSGFSSLVPSVDWLLYSAIRKEALLTSQIEGTQATLTDLFDEEAGLAVSNTDDVEEVTNYSCLPPGAGPLARPERFAHQRAPAVRCAPAVARWCAWHWQAARRAAPLTKLDRWHTPWQCGLCTAPTRARGRLAGGYGALHPR